MKRFLLGMSAIATLAVLPALEQAPAVAGLFEAGSTIAQRLRQPDIKLTLSADKKVVTLDKNGQEKVNWKSIKDGAVVQPGDVLRYRLSGRNVGDAAAANLVLNQPIPPQMSYVMNSAQNNAGMPATYSIDGGKTFYAKPKIKVKQADGRVVVKPAPAKLYTHVRWDVKDQVQPKGQLSASYEVVVR